MGRAATIITKVNRVLRDLNVTSLLVYKRLLSRGGGDPLIGKPDSVTFTDTLLSPQPAIFFTKSDQAKPQPLVLNAGKSINASEYVFYLSPSAMTQQELENKDYVLVTKDALGSFGQEFFIESVQPSIIEGAVVLWKIIARSKKRG